MPRNKKMNKAYFKLSKKAVSPAVYSFKFTNLFTHTKYDHISLKSPPFKFAKATWCLDFCAETVFAFRSSKREIEVSLVRLCSEEPQQKIVYTISLLDANDAIYYDNFHNVKIFEKDKENQNLGRFSDFSRSCDKRPNLTLTMYLFSDEITDVERDDPPIAIDRDMEALCQDFKELLLNEKNHDLILKVTGKEFKVHRSILMARSKVFEAMLSHDMKERTSGVIDVPDCDPQSMKQFLLYMYSGKVKILNQDNVLGLYYIAGKYNMTLLKEECNEFIKNSLSPSNICDVIQFALNHDDSILLEYATEYFVSHTSDILPTVEWMSFMKFNFTAANELLIKASKKWECTK